MMRNDYDATAKDQSNYYVHWPVAVGRLLAYCYNARGAK